MKTFTPELSPEVPGRLAEYAASFADDFPNARPARWAGVYLQGLLLDGERKSVEPLSHRVSLPEGLAVKDVDQALQQFVSQSPRDERAVLRRYRSLLAETFASPKGIFLFDDVSFPKQGKCPVGVQRQYCGALGKKANCQVAVSVHHVGPPGHYPLDMRLYLPDSWLSDKERLDKAGVPEAERRELTKPEIALELLDRVRAEGLPGWAVVAGAGYGVSGDFRDGLEARGLSYIVGVKGDSVVFTREPRWEMPGPGGAGPAEDESPPGRGLPAADGPERAGQDVEAAEGDVARGDEGCAVGAFHLAACLAGVGLAGRRVRGRGPDVATDRGAGGRRDQVRLQQPAPPDGCEEGGASVEEPVAGGAGVPADEGGAGAGPLRGAVLARPAPPRGAGDAGVRLPAAGASPRGRSPGQSAGKKGGPRPPLTLPGIRRALQRLLMPLAKPDCPYCRSHLNLPLVA